MTASSEVSVEALLSRLPAYLVARDEEIGARVRAAHPAPGDRPAREFGPLRSLLAAVAIELERIEDGIDGAYDDLFIETCADWVVPYLAALVGTRLPHESLLDVIDARSLVADTVALRRRKGTIGGLEAMVDAAGHPWRAAATESFRALARTQHLDHLVAGGGTIEIRDPLATSEPDGPFDPGPHTVDVRRARDGGRFGIRVVPIDVWRLGVDRRRRSVPSSAGGRRFRFDPLGRDVALWRHPLRLLPDERVGRAHVPAPWTRRRAAAEAVWGLDVDIEMGVGFASLEEFDGNGDPLIRYCDLSDDPAGGWNHDDDRPATRIDPELGRFVLGTVADPVAGVHVTYHRGHPGFFGGGAYERAPVTDLAPVPGTDPMAVLSSTVEGLVQIDDSSVHQLPARLTVADNSTLVVAAANGEQPVVTAARPVELRLGANATLVLDGLWIDADLIAVTTTNLEAARLRLCDCDLGPPGTLTAASPALDVEIVRSIVGPLRLATDVEVRLEESVVDAGALDGGAITGLAGTVAGRLTAEASTVLGQVHVRAVGLVSDSIVAGVTVDGSPPMTVDRRQVGCVRYSALPPGSVTPRRYRATEDLPVFLSTDHAEAAYALLDPRTPASIATGASNGAEMGVFRRWNTAARDAFLYDRLDEFGRFGMDAGVHHVT